jgi:hypothetical protein
MTVPALVNDRWDDLAWLAGLDVWLAPPEGKLHPEGDRP